MVLVAFLTFLLTTHIAGTLVHRFFAHRCFQTSRLSTLLLYVFCSLQTRPIQWASLHRRHHRHSDTDLDPHPPGRKGFLYAYVGWLTDRENFGTQLEYVRDWAAEFPELLLLDLVVRMGNRVQRLGFFLAGATAKYILLLLWPTPPTIVLQCQAELASQAAQVGHAAAVHMSLLFNAYAHQVSDNNAGVHAYASKDLRSRAFALISSGESYHNRHHKFPRLAQNAPHWHQDWVFWCIRFAERLELVWKVQTSPKRD